MTGGKQKKDMINTLKKSLSGDHFTQYTANRPDVYYKNVKNVLVHFVASSKQNISVINANG